MTNQVETSVFSSVYQWETADPVLGGLGGIANLPLLQLTQRTKYSYDQHVALAATVATLAPNNSPSLTGIPRSVTPPLDATGTEIATAAFIRGINSGATGIAISGNYYLSTLQAGYGILGFAGTLSADVYVLFPNTVPGRWIVANACTKGILCRLSPGGNSVRIAPGKTQTVWTDGVNMAGGHTDFDSIALTGTPTTPLAADGDNSNQVASTAWATRSGNELIAAAVALLAPKNNPSLTGVPRSVTPAADASGTEIATAAFVRTLLSGSLGVVIAANYYLTTVQAGYGILNVSGITSGATFLLFPPVGGQWIVFNNTNKPLLCRYTAGGSQVQIAVGKTQTVWGDTANMLGAMTDFDSIGMTGTPTTPTPPDNDSSAVVPNTYWVTKYGSSHFLTAGSTQTNHTQSIYTPTDNSTHTCTLTFTTAVAGQVLVIGSINLGDTGRHAPGGTHTIYVNGVALDSDSTQGPQCAHGSILLPAGTHTVSSNYVTAGSAAALGNSWCSTSQNLSFYFVQG